MAATAGVKNGTFYSIYNDGDYVKATVNEKEREFYTWKAATDWINITTIKETLDEINRTDRGSEEKRT